MASIQTKSKSGFTFGLEFDHLAIRAVKLSQDGKGGSTVDAMIDVTGNFAEESALVDGLRQAKDRLKMAARDVMTTCVSGKQVSASQITFRNLPPEEMEQALKLEMRKSIPFEIAGSTLDYQVLGVAGGQSETAQVLVALSGAGIVSRQIQVLEKAGMTPYAVDVLPVAVANALWIWIGAPKNDSPHVAVHIGPQISTVVIDGAKSSFFNRYVYFAAEDFVGQESGTSESEKRTQALAEEIARSLAFYEKSTFATGFQEILLLGEFLDTPGMAEKIKRQTGLAVRKMDIPRKMGLAHEMPPGRFDLALSLALRAGQD